MMKNISSLSPKLAENKPPPFATIFTCRTCCTYGYDVLSIWV